MSDGELTHFNASGDAHMVDVGHKDVTVREATAEGWIEMQPDTLARIVEGSHKKGDVLGIARVAAIMGAKKTPDLIPLAHPINITSVDVVLTPVGEKSAVHCKATVGCGGQTGVEMEALTSVQMALLTIYDMCKAVDKGMVMKDICLLAKSGGKSGTWTRG